MNTIANRILLRLSIFILVLFGMICFGLYSMEIEDHYGDLQDLYYQSSKGDIILNKSKSEIGFISNKNWKRIEVETKPATVRGNPKSATGYRPINELS